LTAYDGYCSCEHELNYPMDPKDVVKVNAVFVALASLYTVKRLGKPGLPLDLIRRMREYFL